MGCNLLVDCEDSGLTAVPTIPKATDCLIMRHNPLIGKLPAGALEAQLAPVSAQLRLLDLHGCRLGQLRVGMFRPFTELRWLGLEGNNLETLHEDIFRPLTQLTVLQLTGPYDAAMGGTCWPLDKISAANKEYCDAHIAAGNKLGLLPPSIFQGLDSLRVLMLHHNKLTLLPPTTFQSTPGLMVLKLLDNEQWYENSDVRFANMTLPQCPKGEASKGQCLQLDLIMDSGDELEEIWANQDSFWGPPYEGYNDGHRTVSEL